ncbi:MAG: hypothetical protein ACOYIT_07700 [Christensenellales bacterium]|jgi:hypothetical protein
MKYNKQDLLEAKRQINSIVHKLNSALETMQGKENPERLKPQITLAKRRIKALNIAEQLIDDAINSADAKKQQIIKGDI